MPRRYDSKAALASVARRCASGVGLSSNIRVMSADHGRSRCRSASGTPSSSAMTATGTSSSRSAIRSNSPSASAPSIASPTMASIRGRSASTVRGVNAVDDQPSQARVVGRLHVDHLDRQQVPERRLVLGRGRATPRLVGGDVEIRAAQPPVAQQRVDVGVTRDEPLVRALVIADGRLVTESGEGRVGIGHEGRVPRVVAELRRRGRPAPRSRRPPWMAWSTSPDARGISPRRRRRGRGTVRGRGRRPPRR